jgi:CRP/FNR family transcriptional regulator
MLSESDKAFLIDTLTFWDHLSEPQRALLENNAAALQYPKGATVHSGEQNCIGVLLIKRGELRVYILSEQGKEITLFRLRSGEVCILSASCILNNITFDVHIDAESPTDVLLIPSVLYRQLCDQNIYADNFTCRLAMDSFSDVMWAMEQILFMSFDRRLAVFLLDEAARTGSDTVSLTHEQIAKYMGSAREVVSRMLKYFASEKIVELSRGGVRILDKRKLKAMA